MISVDELKDFLLERNMIITDFSISLNGLESGAYGMHDKGQINRAILPKCTQQYTLTLELKEI